MRHTATLCICALGLSLFSLQAVAQPLRAAATLRKLTPDPLLPVSGGVGTPKPATTKKGELFARVLVLEKGSLRIAIVGIDNLGWTSVLGDRSRQRITGIPPQHILIGATHTHSAPDAYAFPDATGKHGADLAYLDWCTQQVADAVNEAIRNLQPAAVRTAVGEAKGKIAYNYYAPDLYDPRCGVIQAVATSGDRKGSPIATLVNYAVHPEVLGNDQGILSPDLCGPLYDRIEARTGGVALFMNGAQGGMVTADNRTSTGKDARTWEECVRIGEQLADEALRIIAPAKADPEADLFCQARQIRFPVESPMMRFILKHSPLQQPGGREDAVSTQLNLLNIGAAQVLTIPGEALPNIGYYIKRNMKTDQAFLFGLTNDAFGYILTSVDFNSFKRYDYVSRTSLGEMTGEIYIREALKLIQDCPPAGK